MPGVLRDTKLTDFFERRSPLLSSQLKPSTRTSSHQAPDSSPSPIPIVVKRRPGRPKGSGKSPKTASGRQRQHDHVVSASLDQPPFPGGSGEFIPNPGSSPLRSSNSSPPVKRRPGRPRGPRKGATTYSQDASLLHSSRQAVPRNSCDIKQPLNSAPRQLRVRLLSSPLSSPPRSSTPSKRKLDDDDDTASVTSSMVPLSLYYTPRQPSSQRLSKPRKAQSPRGLSSSRAAKKRRHNSPLRSPQALLHPVTPARSRGDREVIPTSQPDELGLYSPARPQATPRHKSAVHESVENWRHGRSAYIFETVSPLRFGHDGDYSMEIDRPLSPLTSCPQSLTLGSPLSSFTDLDTAFPEAELDMLPSPLSLPSPMSTSAGRPTLAQIATPRSLRPVTPPPSSPEQEQPTPVPVAPKDSKMRTAEIINEIWESVRAKSPSDSEDSRLHAPFRDELSSEEEDEPFWKSNKTLAR